MTGNRTFWPCSLVLSAALGLAGCGGGGGGSDAPNPVAVEQDAGWQSGVFAASEDFANRCEDPRSGIDPYTGSPYPDQAGSGLDERNFLRSWSHEDYLWYDEIIDRDPADYATLEYFELLKTDEQTASGNPKDQFHFTIPTSEWRSMSQSGVSVNYGLSWALINSAPPRELRVAYVEPASPAAAAGLSRGVEVLEIDGVDVAYGNDTDTLNAGLSPAADGESHSFRIRELNGSERTVTLTATEISSTPVLEVATVSVSDGKLGYILFNDHIATAEEGLVDAIQELELAGVQDLVLDLRYNGGGYLDIAAQLAYMIAGPASTSGADFETLTFNDKRSDENTPIPFHSETLGFASLTPGQPLPTLNLDRVFVLTGPGTCSASESIMNGLRGVNLEVIQIGAKTCGKPYGFYAQDNCGTSYFTVEFRGENNLGFGDYPDGFSPQDSLAGGTSLPGCEVGDDFMHALGDPAEGRFAAALHYRDNPDSPCSLATSSSGMQKVGAPSSSLSNIDAEVIKPFSLPGRIMERER